MHTKVRLETQRQRVTKEHEKEVQHLEERLLTLLHQHEQLRLE